MSKIIEDNYDGAGFIPIYKSKADEELYMIREDEEVVYVQPVNKVESKYIVDTSAEEIQRKKLNDAVSNLDQLITNTDFLKLAMKAMTYKSISAMTSLSVVIILIMVLLSNLVKFNSGDYTTSTIVFSVLEIILIIANLIITIKRFKDIDNLLKDETSITEDNI